MWTEKRYFTLSFVLYARNESRKLTLLDQSLNRFPIFAVSVEIIARSNKLVPGQFKLRIVSCIVNENALLLSRYKVSLNPVRILKNQAGEEKAEIARLSLFVGAIAVGDLVKSTLGPKGMDKILVAHGRSAGQVQITNDGATILKSVGVDNPAAKILVDMSRVQDDEVGDGTTSVTVLGEHNAVINLNSLIILFHMSLNLFSCFFIAAELLREAEKLIEQKIHPQTIITGWRNATNVAREALKNVSADNSADPQHFREDLLNIARTTLSSKILSQHKEHFSKLAVDAVLRLKGSGNLSAIQIIKKRGATLADSFLDEGFLLDKKPGIHQPKKVSNANILIANTSMDTDKIKVYVFFICPISRYLHLIP